MKRDRGLDRLLCMDGQSFSDESGYWWKIEARRVAVTPERPHGIKYSLTLHDKFGERILGFDNAHALPGKSRKAYTSKYTGEIVEYDHRHDTRTGKVIPYSFQTADQLLVDFFTAVNKVIDS